MAINSLCWTNSIRCVIYVFYVIRKPFFLQHFNIFIFLKRFQACSESYAIALVDSIPANYDREGKQTKLRPTSKRFMLI